MRDTGKRGPATTPDPASHATNTSVAGTTDNTSPKDTALDLGAILARIADLDDEQLQALVKDLDSALPDCLGGPLDGTDMDLIAVAAAARITLRRRKSAAGRRRAAQHIHHLMSTENE